MVRISGVNIPEDKKIWVALTYLYGVGPKNVLKILETARIDINRRAKELTEDEVQRVQKIVDTLKIEGDLRREVAQNIKRLQDIGTYRGQRHAKNLPARGQRTRSNARTKRGKRVTIGAVKKELAARMSHGAGSAPGGQKTQTVPAKK